ncbi:MAG TPA: ATP synthase F1 subunit delta [Bacteroidia bacterium]|nr:ATP synthase F1 subunit delta [Bacteroidia bacterium]
MTGTRVSYRYAKSLLDLSLEKGQLEQVHEDMQLVLNTIRGSRDLELLLKSPVIKTDKKDDILKAIFGGKIGVITTAFIDILTRKRREGYLESVADSFVNQYKKHKKILTAVVTTALGLDESLREQVVNVVKQGGKSEVELQEKVDANIIGGFILRVGDNQVDASIIRQIKNLERTFNENPYIKDF